MDTREREQLIAEEQVIFDSVICDIEKRQEEIENEIQRCKEDAKKAKTSGSPVAYPWFINELKEKKEKKEECLHIAKLFNSLGQRMARKSV